MREHSRLRIRRRFGGHPNVSSTDEAFGLSSPKARSECCDLGSRGHRRGGARGRKKTGRKDVMKIARRGQL